MRNKLASSDQLEALRALAPALAATSGHDVGGGRFATGLASLDDHLGGGLGAASLHDLYAGAGGDAPAALGFALGLAWRAAQATGERRPLIWGMDEGSRREIGRPYGPGLAELGLDPERVLLVEVRDAAALLGVGEEALASPAVGAVVLGSWGESKVFSLTASRRLAMAARTAGRTLMLVRAGADPTPGAAETRWRVRAASSAPLEAGAPGHPAVEAALIRHRGGVAPRTWIMEWDREQRSFIAPPPLSGGLVSRPADRAGHASAPGEGLRRAG
ncbi:ImuA family protein [Brevundimonas sp.]|uniref:ImuA family protein n=1 Tax=Brevundimonas sp. TaxID=1871086 RepID=UPI0035AE8BA1